MVAEDERDAGPRQVLNLGHTVGHAIEARHRLFALPPRRGGGDRPARGAAPVRPRRAARRGGRPAGRAGAAHDLRGRERRTRWWRLRPRQEAQGGRVPFVLVQSPGDVTPGPRRGARRRCCAAIEEVLRRMNAPGGRDARGQPRPARPAATPSSTATFTLSELEVAGQGLRAGARRPRATFCQTNHEGEYCEELHLARERADGLILNAGRVDATTPTPSAMRWRCRGLPAVEVHISDIENREEMAPPLGDPRRVHRPRAGQGPGGLPRGARACCTRRSADERPRQRRTRRPPCGRASTSASWTACSSPSWSTCAT